jgi:hypothetical protein
MPDCVPNEGGLTSVSSSCAQCGRTSWLFFSLSRTGRTLAVTRRAAVARVDTGPELATRFLLGRPSSPGLPGCERAHPRPRTRPSAGA